MNESSPAPRLTPVQWLICGIAAIGFAFDIYELLMLPLIIKPALFALGGEQMVPGSPEYKEWARILFFVPAIAGGVFGLIGGWLTDKLGRRRVLTWSILLYAGSACAAGFSTSLPMLLVLRCGVFVGVCVEFVAAVAWLAELFPEPARREKVLGLTQAFSSFGGFLVAISNRLCVNYGDLYLPSIYDKHEAWRYTLISGLIPAIPLILIRPFLPESPAWEEKRAKGLLKRPSLTELFQPALRKTTIVTTLLFGCSYGLAFGAIQHLPQMVPGFADVKAAVKVAQTTAKEKAEQSGKPAPKEKAIEGKVNEDNAATVTTWQETGGLLGRILLAIAALNLMSRRNLLRMFLIPSMFIVPGLFWWMGGHLTEAGALTSLKWGAFAAGVVIVSQFSFWGNYIPQVYPLHLRGTGESFAANIGGRVLGTSMAWVFFSFSDAKPPNPSKMAHTAAVIALAVSLCGLVLTFFLPEPNRELSDE